MKKLIILIVIVSTALIFGFSNKVKAYEVGTFYSDYTDFPENLYNSIPKSFNLGTNFTVIDSDLIERDVRLNLTLRNDVQRRLYIDIELFSTTTGISIQYNSTTMIQSVSSTANIGSIAYNIDHSSPSLNKVELEIGYSIGGFDGTYEYLNGTIITPELNIESFYSQKIRQEIDHNFTLLNEVYNYGDYVAYNNGYEFGREIGFGEGFMEGIDADLSEVLDEAYDNGFDDGYVDGVNDAYDVGYDDGYDDGVQVSQSTAYNDGYIKGSNDSFSSKLSDWIVPAIIVVIILGGFVTIIQKRKNGDT